MLKCAEVTGRFYKTTFRGIWSEKNSWIFYCTYALALFQPIMKFVHIMYNFYTYRNKLTKFFLFSINLSYCGNNNVLPLFQLPTRSTWLSSTVCARRTPPEATPSSGTVWQCSVHHKLWFFSLHVRYSTPLHLPPFRFTVSEDAGIEPRTPATLALTAYLLSNKQKGPIINLVMCTKNSNKYI